MRSASLCPPALLYRQTLALAFFAGIFASVHFLPGITALALLALACRDKLAKLQLLAVFILCFVIGFSYAPLRMPQKGPVPAWLQEASAPVLQGEKRSEPSKGVLLQGRVKEVRGLTDRRSQVLLEQVKPVDRSLADADTPVPGLLNLTWTDPPWPEGFRKLPGAVKDSRTDSAAILPGRPLPGQTLMAELKPREVHGLKNPGTWDIEPYWHMQSVWYRAYTQSPAAPPLEGESNAPQRWRENLRLRVLQALPTEDGQVKPGAQFIPALLFGDRFLLDTREMELMSAATLSHSLALSGLHLSYAAALGFGFIFILYRLKPGLGLILPRRKAGVLAALVPALFYLWLGGVPPSLVRSFCMLCFWGALLFMHRPSVLADGLLWAVALILLVSPLSIFDLRLQMSALAVAGIALFMPLISSVSASCRAAILGKKPGPARRAGARFCQASILIFLTSLAVQLTLYPLVTSTFGLNGLAFPLNVIWLPVLGAAVMPLSFLGLAAAAVHLDALAQFCFYLAALPCEYLVSLLGQLEQNGLLPQVLPVRPHWLAMLGWWAVLLCIPRLLNAFKNRIERPAYALLPMLCGVLILVAPLGLRYYETQRNVVRLRLLDVGQGQSVLLEWPGGGRLLLDGGGGPSPRFDVGRSVVAATLTDNRPTRLDYMIATHPDQDHIQGLLFPLKHMKIGYYADNGVEDSSKLYASLSALLQTKGITAERPSRGERLDLAPDLWLETVHPAKEHALKGNEASLVFRLVWKGKGLAMLCGDVEKAGQRDILKSIAGGGDASFKELKSQIIVLPHHGAAGSLLPAFYDEVKPELALVSSGYGNRWGFPARAVRDALEEREIPMLNTAVSGQIIVEWELNGGEMTIRTARDIK